LSVVEDAEEFWYSEESEDGNTQDPTEEPSTTFTTTITTGTDFTKLYFSRKKLFGQISSQNNNLNLSD
jgi:hypothetical protein